MYLNSMATLPQLRRGKSRSINWENRSGAKGAGCQAASALGPSRKGSPCIGRIESGEMVNLFPPLSAAPARWLR